MANGNDDGSCYGDGYGVLDFAADRNEVAHSKDEAQKSIHAPMPIPMPLPPTISMPPLDAGTVDNHLQ